LQLIDRQGRLLGKLHLLDFAAGVLLIGLFPLILFALHNWSGLRELKIYEVSPKKVMAGTVETVAVRGSGFDRAMTAQLGSFPFQEVVFLNNARVDVTIPKGIPEGIYQLGLRNSRGRLVVQKEAFEVLWKPSIEGWLPIQVTNLNGSKAVLEKAVLAPKLKSIPARAIVVLRYSELDSLALKRLAPGYLELGQRDSNAARTVTILECQEPHGKQANGTALVQTLLPIDILMNWEKQQFIYRGQELLEGREIEVRVPGSSLRAQVASRPFPLLQVTGGEE